MMNALTVSQAKALEAIRKACADTGSTPANLTNYQRIKANGNAVRSLEQKGLVRSFQDENYRWFLKIAD